MYLLRTLLGVQGPHGQPHDCNRVASAEGDVDEVQQYKQSVAASVHYNNDKNTQTYR